MAENNEKTEEQKKEELRESSLQSLNNDVYNSLAAVFFIHDSGNYGEGVESPMEQFFFKPLLGSSEAADLISKSFEGSRKGGKRYTGQAGEYELLESAGKIIQQSSLSVKTDDLASIMGYSGEISDSYKGQYVGDLMQSEEGKKVAQTLLGSYQQYLVNGKISEAMSKNNEAIRKGLEGVLYGNEEN